jgi:hypothetical protein
MSKKLPIHFQLLLKNPECVLGMSKYTIHFQIFFTKFLNVSVMSKDHSRTLPKVRFPKCI